MPVAQDSDDVLTLNGVLANTGCLNCFSQQEKQALIVYTLALSAKALGLTDLTNVNDLREAVACFDCMSDGQLQSWKAAIAKDFADDLGATPENPAIDTLRDYIKCLVCVPQRELRVAELYLMARIFDVVEGLAT